MTIERAPAPPIAEPEPMPVYAIPAMIEWEYSIWEIPYSNIRRTLHEMGPECWELVSAIPGDAIDIVLIFKRPRVSEEEG